MRFDRIRIKGLGPFREETTIDFGAMPGTLVALTGKNGAGKSTALELLGGALYRDCPTRGSLVGLATSRDAFLEVDCVNGASHRIRHNLDAVSGKGETLLTDGDGNPRLDSTKVKSFDAWAAGHLPAPSVFYSSTFAAQGSGGFLRMTSGERKAVLLRALGIERLEALAKAARDEMALAREAHAAHAGRLDEAKRRTGNVDELKAAHEKAQRLQAAAAAEVAAAESALAVAHAALTEWLVQDERYQAEERERSRLATERAALEAQVASLSLRLTNNRAVLDGADAIRAAVAELAKLDQDLAVAKSDAANAWERYREADASEKALGSDEPLRLRRGELEREVHDIRNKIAALELDLDAANLPPLEKLTDEVELLERELAAFACQTRELEIFRLEAKDQRIVGLRSGLEAAIAGELGQCRVALADDDDLADREKSAPDAARELQRLSEEKKTEWQTARVRLARVQELLRHRDTRAGLERDLERVSADLAERRAAFDAAAARTRAASEAFGVANQRPAAIDAQRSPIVALAAKAEPLAHAEARIAELEPQIADAVGRLAQIDKQLVGGGPAPGPKPDPATVEAMVAVARHASASTSATVAAAEAALKQGAEAADHLASLATSVAAAERALADWTRLAADLGRDGLQALEIDAAGPELTELVNDLLHTCHGPRFTVTIEASRQSADGKRVLEGCEVRVLDTVQGREGPAESLSGGEAVLVGEAVSLALSMLACRRSGVTGATLVRDETGAALDADAASAYVAMLRRAATLVGASKVIFVSHSKEVQELADVRVEIADGQATVCQ